jgi:hypothetical protein
MGFGPWYRRVAALLCLACVSNALGDGLRAALRPYESSSNRSMDSKAGIWGIRMDAAGDLGLGPWSLDAQACPDWNSDAPFNSDFVRRFSARFDSGSVSVVVGRQIIKWGRADFYSPSDVLGPSDLSRLALTADDRRMGTDAAQTTLYAGEYAVHAVLIPHFRPSPSPLARGSQAGSDAEWVFGKPGTGLRLERQSSRAGWSLAAYSGKDARIHYRVGAKPEAEHPRIALVAADWEMPLGKGVFRGEAAYVKRRGAEAPTRSDVEWNAGWEWDLPGNFHAEAAVMEFWIPGYTSPDSPARGAQDRLNNQLAKLTAIPALHIGWQSQEQDFALDGEILANPRTKDFHLRPMARWSPGDRISLVAGGEFFGGPADSYFGQFKANDLVLLESRIHLK